MVSKSIPDFDVEICLVSWEMSIYLALQSCETQRPYYIYMRDDCDVPYRIGEKILNTLYAWTPLKLINVF